MKKIFRNIGIICLSLVLLVPSFVHAGHGDKIQWLVDHEFIHGKSKTSVDLDLGATLTRAEATKLIVEINQASGKTEMDKGVAREFPDVPKDHWAYNYIQLASKDFIKGYEDGSFKPNRKITKAEFTTIVLRVAGLEVDETKAWPNNYIDKAVEAKILQGEPGDVGREILREEAFNMVYNSLEYNGTVAKINGDKDQDKKEENKGDKVYEAGTSLDRGKSFDMFGNALDILGLLK